MDVWVTDANVKKCFRYRSETCIVSQPLHFLLLKRGRCSRLNTVFCCSYRRVPSSASVTADYGLHFEAGQGTLLQAWSDADWGRDLDKRRSRSGIVLMLGGNPIMWTSKLQPSVSLSTAEAEFYERSECVRDVAWARQMMKEFGLEIHEPTTVYQDNLGTISWTEEDQGLRKVKHVGLRYHYVKEAVQQQNVKVLYASSEENRADSLTKALVGSSFVEHRSFVKVNPLSPRGGVSEKLLIEKFTVREAIRLP